eukprot:CAMPEP_0195301578 /NCGR_PEP_ID=MMETSP0707-20130614/29529_1 /TAXON_ID=33640 /ORGANISM="Asterionellopsis glacialis, Strain CCMP134" /LENGTH=346 /DNA_ID=CAMNT_0040364557 /DNA_START=100 /DNA_END=1140 /DNA_ORIENTATION=-
MRRQIRFVCVRLFLLVTFCAVCGQAARSSNAVPLSASRIFRGGAVVADAAADGSANLGPLGIFVKTIQEARRHLAAAGVARCISIFAMYPMDTIKTRMQMEQSNPLRVAGLYKGVGGSLFGQVPYGILTFGSYEMYKNAMLENFPGTKPVFLYALAAIMGDLTGSGWLCPSEVVKQQMQAGMYATTGEAVSKIWAKKGLVGFYQGYLGGVTRDVPFRVAQLTSYEVTKNVYLRAKARRAAAAAPGDPKVVQELSPVDAAVCGAIAGSFSAAITSPLDRIKTLLMTDSAAYGGSVISCTQKIWQQEGIKGFAAGVVPRVTYIAPSVVIFFIAYEQTKQRLFPAPKED